MILCDREIREALEQQRLVIDPAPTPELYSSTSLDLRLGKPLRLWNRIPETQPTMGLVPRFRPAHQGFVYKQLEDQFTSVVELTEAEEGGHDIPPRGFVLGYTLEKIYLPYRSRLCARVEGKSSLARLGLGVHVTAPTIHAGFGFNTGAPAESGTPLVLEIWNAGPLPIELRYEMRICQLILEEVREVPTTGYVGQFNQQSATLPPGPQRPRRRRRQ